MARILVLGIGNAILGDDGLGIHAIHELAAHHRFAGNVTLVDGGTQGARLLGLISEHDLLVVIDAVDSGAVPGALTEQRLDRTRAKSTEKCSAHEVDLVDALEQAKLLGILPETILFGIQPEHAGEFGTELSEPVRAAMPELFARVRACVERAGGGLSVAMHA
jgi:hydrogenase maturation protease